MLTLVLALLHVAPSAANATEPEALSAPTEMKGWVARPLLITNSGGRRLACRAELAHWFSRDLATLDADQTARLELWFDPLTGTSALRGSHGEPIPVEALWCGVSGRAYRTRALIPLGRGGASILVACRSEGEKVVCSPS